MNIQYKQLFTHPEFSRGKIIILKDVLFMLTFYYCLFFLTGTGSKKKNNKLFFFGKFRKKTGAILSKH